MEKCDLWTHGISANGRPYVRVLAYRLLLANHLGLPLDALDGKEVLHTCDNPLCVNIKHLRLGTHSDNMKDKQSKGRAAKKLTSEKVAYIRCLDTNGLLQREIAERVGISQSMVSSVLRGESWSHVDVQ